MEVRQFSERNSTITSEPPSSRISSIIGDNYDGSSASQQSTTADPYEASGHDLDVIDDDDEEYDRFDLEGIPMPRQSSTRSSIPIEIIQPSRQGMYESEDPLFQGVCLYHTSSSAGGNITATATKESNNKRRPSSSSHHMPISWFFPSIFKHLLYMQQQR